ncbi:MAG: hypothetical protein ACLFV4_02050 [Candidatus Hydrogenedentota bacterium]
MKMRDVVVFHGPPTRGPGRAGHYFDETFELEAALASVAYLPLEWTKWSYVSYTAKREDYREHGAAHAPGGHL